MECENCNEEHDGQYGSGRFCSSKCARGFSTKLKRIEINEKVSKTLIGKQKSNRKIINCKYCNKEIEITVNDNRLFCNLSCAAKCNIENSRKGGRASAKSQQRRSRNEIKFAELCKERFKNVLTNEPIFNGWDADIILENEKIAILWNGPWHYVEGITKDHKLKQVQNRDKIKLKEIILAGYKPYIIKDMGRENKEFAEKQFKVFLDYMKEK